MRREIISETKCVDGICRKQCSIPTSSCTSERPIRCTDGSCVTLMEQCASPRCTDDRPYMCADGQCRDSMMECKYPFNISVVKRYDVTKTEAPVQAYVLRNQKNERSATVFATGAMNFKIRGIALSEVEATKLTVSGIYDPVYVALFSKTVKETLPREFIRSAVVNVELELKPADPTDPHHVTPSFVVVLKTNKIKTDTLYRQYKPKHLFCLAALQDGTWTCVSRIFNTIRRNKFTYEVAASGTYAVIFAPDVPVADFVEDEFCGILCKDKKRVFTIAFFGVPLLLVLFYILYKL